MNVTVYDSLMQGSPEWLEARAGLITASTIGRLLTATGKPSKGDTAKALVEELAVQRATGRVVPVTPTWPMRRGTALEPYARDEYAMLTGSRVTETGFMVATLDSGVQVGYSPDGLIDDSGLLEIKCLSAGKHWRTILRDEVPSEHVAQVQTGLFVSGRDWCDYFSYMPGDVPYTIRVTPDEEWQTMIRDVVEAVDQEIDELATLYEENTRGIPVTPDFDIDL